MARERANKRRPNMKEVMIDRSKPVAQWPDCREKYDKLMEEFKATPAGKKFLDEQF